MSEQMYLYSDVYSSIVSGHLLGLRNSVSSVLCQWMPASLSRGENVSIETCARRAFSTGGKGTNVQQHVCACWYTQGGGEGCVCARPCVSTGV